MFIIGSFTKKVKVRNTRELVRKTTYSKKKLKK